MSESGFAAAIREARAAGRELIDLTVSNPTVCGFQYDAEAILRPLGNVGALTYDPDPRGMRSAREAVAEYYGDHGADVDPDEVVLTTSTSEGYGYLFRLLCDASDEVLVAQPSYPLFDFLADLEDVSPRDSRRRRIQSAAEQQHRQQPGRQPLDKRACRSTARGLDVRSSETAIGGTGD